MFAKMLVQPIRVQCMCNKLIQIHNMPKVVAIHHNYHENSCYTLSTTGSEVMLGIQYCPISCSVTVLNFY